MPPYEQELLEEYLTHLNVIGDEGDYTDFEAWYRTVRYAEGAKRPGHPRGGLGDALQGHPACRPCIQARVKDFS